jgi:hypothetical protein
MCASPIEGSRQRVLAADLVADAGVLPTVDDLPGADRALREVPFRRLPEAGAPAATEVAVVGEDATALHVEELDESPRVALHPAEGRVELDLVDLGARAGHPEAEHPDGRVRPGVTTHGRGLGGLSGDGRDGESSHDRHEQRGHAANHRRRASTVRGLQVSAGGQVHDTSISRVEANRTLLAQ